MATFLMAQMVASLSWVSQGNQPVNGDVSHGLKRQPAPHGFPEDQPVNGDVSHGFKNSSQPLVAFPEDQPVNGDVSHGLKRQPASCGFPEGQPVNGDISHGLNCSQPLMGFPKKPAGQWRRFSWLKPQSASYGFSRATSPSTATFLMAQTATSLSSVSQENQPVNGDVSHSSNGGQPFMGFPRNSAGQWRRFS